MTAVLAAIWLGVGHVLGGVVRRIGHGARELDPAHRRDGLGLTLVGLAILVAFSVWWNVTAGLGGFVGSIVTGALGSLDWTLPFLLLGLAWRVLRRPDESAATGRMTIGWSAIVLSACGLTHVLHGTPVPADGSAAMESGGGWIGWLASAPVVAATHPVVASLLLVLLAVFGLLVVTATPIAAVPERLRHVRDRLLGVQIEGEVEVEPSGPVTTTRRQRRQAAKDAAVDDAGLGVLAGDIAFETPLVAEETSKRRRGSRTVDNDLSEQVDHAEHPDADPDHTSTVVVDLTSGAVVTSPAKHAEPLPDVAVARRAARPVRRRHLPPAAGTTRSSPVRCTSRRARRPTPSSPRSPPCSSSSTSTRRSPATPVVRRSRATRSSSGRP